MRIHTLLPAFFVYAASFGQTTGKIIDADNGETIPYANIQCNGNENIVSNEEGVFTLSQANGNDDAALSVSYVGYTPVETTVGALKSGGLVIRLKPSVFQLSEVQVSKLPGADAIMAQVRKNLKSNYGQSGNAENKIFMRESTAFTPKQLNIAITESTGFTKSALNGFNGELKAYTARVVAQPPREYTDMLFRYYTAAEKKIPAKLDMIKATKLRDDRRSASLEGVQENLSKLLLKHLDTTKYYRMKSGWFGSHDTISLRKDFKRDKVRPRNDLTVTKSSLTGFFGNVSLLAEKYQFIHDFKAYEYTYDGATYLKDGNFAYVISFKPNRSRAIYTGKLYISDSDFAVIRADFKLDEGKKAAGMNLKFLLGLKFSQNLDSGTMLFAQNDGSSGYALRYASFETGQYIYLNRPLEFIELAESEKDVVALDIKMEGNGYKKTEFLSLAHNAVSDADYDKVAEPDFKYLHIRKYDPEIWKDYGAIEPLEEMKRFTVEETAD
jgi:hypothetical protein